MFGIRIQTKRGAKEEAEKPFWISFSDLMTSLMVLFLVTMAASLIAVTKGIRAQAEQGEQRQIGIKGCIESLGDLKKQFPGTRFDQGASALNFGEQATFDLNRHSLTPNQGARVRKIVKTIVDNARNHKQCQNWLKQIVVEGFASDEGHYLYNLNLSYLRSQRVLCVLLDSRAEAALGKEDRQWVAQHFLAGGSSFSRNWKSTRPVKDQRSVELRLEFKERVEESLPPPIDADRLNDPQCPNDVR